MCYIVLMAYRGHKFTGTILKPSKFHMVFCQVYAAANTFMAGLSAQ